MRTVKWSIRDDGNTQWGKHFHGDYVVTICDMDGDGTEWEVWLRREYDSINSISREIERLGQEKWREHPRMPDPIAKGYVCVRVGDDFEAGKAIAIEALDAILRDRATSPTPAGREP
jgi:hypothetical protein